MLLGILVPVVLILVGAVVGFVWYRRKMEAMKPGDAPVLSGVRLTAERLRSLDGAWRIVHEIPPGRIGDIDHVAVGPPGVIALRTVVGDRPAPAAHDDSAEAVARAAVARGDVDDLVRAVGGRCDVVATVWWGAPNTEWPAGLETAPGAWAVEGQRLGEWLASLAAVDSSPARVDQWWQAVTIGVGRPDPLG